MINIDEAFAKYYPAIFRFCLQMLRNKADAEDAVQTTFLKAQKSIQLLQSETAIKPWLYQIARNSCLDHYRVITQIKKSLKTIFFESSYEPYYPETPLLRLIQELPLKQREVFILRHLHEFSTKETAEFLNLDEGTVKSHLSRSIKQLRLKLEIIGICDN